MNKGSKKWHLFKYSTRVHNSWVGTMNKGSKKWHLFKYSTRVHNSWVGTMNKGSKKWHSEQRSVLRWPVPSER